MKRVAGAIIIIVLSLVCSAAARAQQPIQADKQGGQPDAGAAPSTLVAVLVKIPIPPGVDRAKMEAGMLKTVPVYQNLPGLVRKYFTISDDQKFGGIYLWESRKTAEAYYNDDWRARALKNYGAPADVAFFDVPIVVQGLKPQTISPVQSSPGATPSTLVAVLVKIPIPPGVDRAKMEAGMLKTVPIYQNLPGLVRKYFTISDDQKFGGIYLWESRKTAEAYYNDDWHARALKNYGAPADVAFFDVPIVVEGLQPQK